MAISVWDIKRNICNIDPSGIMDCGLMVDADCLNGNNTSVDVRALIDQVVRFSSEINADHGVVIGTFADSVIRTTAAFPSNYQRLLNQPRAEKYDGSNLFAAIHHIAEIADCRFGLSGQITQKVQHRACRRMFGGIGVKWYTKYMFPVITTEMFYHLTIVTGDSPLCGPDLRSIKQLLVRLSRTGFFVRVLHVGTDSRKRELLGALNNIKRQRMRNDYDANDVDVSAGVYSLMHNFSAMSLAFDLPDDQFVTLMTGGLGEYIASGRARGILTPARRV